jgi:flagellar motor switch protein FliN
MSSSASSSSSSVETALVPQAPAPQLDMGRLQDLVCQVDVVLGTGTMTVRECLSLRRHKLIRLSQGAGADLQVLANGIPIAQGEVVIIEDSTAVRLTEILAPPSMGRAE